MVPIDIPNGGEGAALGSVHTVGTTCSIHENTAGAYVGLETVTGERDGLMAVDEEAGGAEAVSYTHLTLPTIYSV